MQQLTEDIRTEPMISRQWNISRESNSVRPMGVFVTGANSFIGCHVVHQLSHSWPGEIHLLVRADSSEKAFEKMEKAFHEWKPGSFKHEAFTIHAGDVCQEHFALSETEFNQLNQSVGYVVHLAMNPLYHLPYKHFKRVWVPELEKMIQFCANSSYPKSLHYPSSYNANFFTEASDFDRLNHNAWQSGYAGFKWVANGVIQNAFSQHLSGCIYDIPLVLGSVKNGCCPVNYSIWHILDMFLQTGKYINFEFRVIPVDVLAKIMVNNMLMDAANCGVPFIRPILPKPVNEKLFSKMATLFFGLRHGTQEQLREACLQKRKFDFMIPPDFYSLLKKVNGLKAVLPESVFSETLPPVKKVFMRNLRHAIAQKELIKT